MTEELRPPLGMIITALDAAASACATEAARLDDPGMIGVKPGDIAHNDLQARCLRAASEILKRGSSLYGGT